jgi:hypothetical protein
MSTDDTCNYCFHKRSEHGLGQCDGVFEGAEYPECSCERFVEADASTGVRGSTDKVLADVVNECSRQLQLKAAGRFAHAIGDPELTDPERLVILVEEVGEVARAVAEDGGLANDKHNKFLRTELVQVAACAVAWVRGMDGDS